MDTNLLIIIIALAISTVTIILFLRPKKDTTVVEWLKSMNQRLDTQSQQMITAQRTIGEMTEIGKSIKDLQQFLASPKLRGGIGEQVLNQLLAQSLPKQSFNLQYTFHSGAKVDAAIKTASGIIPIDSKFTMENFKKMVLADSEILHEQFKKVFVTDVKNRIDEIAGKYILPDEGTVDFALMYVPSEAVYYEIVNSSSDLMDYAQNKRVMFVSPSTFYAFLRSVLLSFEGQKIASEIKTIQQALRAIHTETSKFAELLSTLQSHINNSYSMMGRVSTSFSSLSSKVENIQSLRSGEKEDKV